MGLWLGLGLGLDLLRVVQDQLFVGVFLSRGPT